jgi:tellurite resistance protein
MLTLFLLAVLLGQLRNLPVCCPFHVSWWSVSFPLAACSVAALRFADAQPGIVTDTVALGLLTLATVVIAGLLVGTLVDLGRGGLPNAYVGG